MDIRQARRELKFHLREGAGQAVLEDIRSMLPADVNGAIGGAYPIVSEYHDTAERDAYWERNRKQRNRRKLRIRIYGTSNGLIPPSAFIEVKHKRDGIGVKRRMRIPLELASVRNFDVLGVIRELRSGFTCRAEQLLAEEIERLVEVNGVRPSLQMRYDRLAFEGPDNVRVTLDSSIRCRSRRRTLMPDDPDFPDVVIPAAEQVLEIKLFGRAPYWLRELAAKHRLTKIPFSKYCNALEMFDPVISPLVGRTGRTVSPPAAA
jgi:SPX domain protein involved in polyphosphate accumulation